MATTWWQRTAVATVLTESRPPDVLRLGEVGEGAQKARRFGGALRHDSFFAGVALEQGDRRCAGVLGQVPDALELPDARRDAA